MDGCRPPTGYKKIHESMALLMVSQPFDIIHVVLCVQNFLPTLQYGAKCAVKGMWSALQSAWQRLEALATTVKGRDQTIADLRDQLHMEKQASEMLRQQVSRRGNITYFGTLVKNLARGLLLWGVPYKSCL